MIGYEFKIVENVFFWISVILYMILNTENSVRSRERDTVSKVVVLFMVCSVFSIVII